MPVKQVIVVRKDLNMRKGKMCAQAAHAAMSFITELLYQPSHGSHLVTIFIADIVREWLDTGMTKIVVGVDGEEELLLLCVRAREEGLKAHLIKDEGRTEFEVPTITALAIGPNYDWQIDKITKELKLL